MARGGGKVRSGTIYHVISRFTAKEWFIESAEERRTYLRLLALAIGKTDWTCICYAVMSSHIHLGLVAGTTPLARWLRPMHSSFANWINARRDRIGGVFVKGPNVYDLRPQGTVRLLDYLHCNPVRGGVVARPTDSDWTSHRAYVGLASRPSWLAVERGLALAGFADGAAFAAWSEGASTTREDLDAFRLTPPTRVGRRRTPQIVLLESRAPPVPAQWSRAWASR